MGAWCLFKFHSDNDVPLRNRRTLNIKARRDFFQSSCWILLELLQEILDECIGTVPFKPALFLVGGGVPTLLLLHSTGL